VNCFDILSIPVTNSQNDRVYRGLFGKDGVLLKQFPAYTLHARKNASLSVNLHSEENFIDTTLYRFKRAVLSHCDE